MSRYNLSKKSLNRLLNLIEFKLKRTKLLSRPVYLTIEPTDACNSRCIMCNKRKLYSSPDFKPGFMSRDIFEKILPLVSFATSTCWGGFGEPFLHPRYGDWAEDLKKRGANLLCFTNGIAMNKSLAEKLVDIQFDNIVISIGGATEQKYKYIRGVNGLKPMLDNLSYLNEIKKASNLEKPCVSFNLVAMNSVLPDLEEILRLARRYNVNSVAMPDLDVQYEENVKESIWNNISAAKDYIEAATEVAQELGIKLVPPTLVEHEGDCRAFFTTMQITFDGVVLSCSTERFKLGSLVTDSPEKIWNNGSYQELRKSYFSKGIKGTCPGCVEWDKSRPTMLTANEDYRSTVG